MKIIFKNRNKQNNYLEGKINYKINHAICLQKRQDFMKHHF